MYSSKTHMVRGPRDIYIYLLAQKRGEIIIT